MSSIIRAACDDGRRVLLRPDGTWAFDQVETRSDYVKHGESGFRRALWGMSRQEVLEAEVGQPVLDDGIVLIYSGSINQLQSNIVYIFLSDILVRAKYMITEPHSNLNNYLDDYESLRGLLVQKYGRPHKDDTVWLNRLYQDEPSGWGMAVAVGHLHRYTGFTHGGTEILLYLNGDNYQVALGIEYLSTRLQSLEAQVKKQRSLDDL